MDLIRGPMRTCCMRVRRLSALAAAVLAITLAGCGGGIRQSAADSADTSPRGTGFYSDGAKVDRCPPGIADAERGPSCTLAYEQVRIEHVRWSEDGGIVLFTASKAEPTSGFEPLTPSLRVKCSTN